MAKSNATSWKLYVGGTGTVIPNIKKIMFEQNRAMIDVTTKDSNHWKEILPGLKNAKFSIDGEVDYLGSGYPLGTLITDFNAGTSIALVFTDADGTTANKRFTCSGYWTKVSHDAGTEDSFKFSAEAEVNGAVTTAAIS